jgi:hypothetical protein
MRSVSFRGDSRSSGETIIVVDEKNLQKLHPYQPILKSSSKKSIAESVNEILFDYVPANDRNK